jgi:hypothetical protein
LLPRPGDRPLGRVRVGAGAPGSLIEEFCAPHGGSRDQMTDRNWRRAGCSDRQGQSRPGAVASRFGGRRRCHYRRIIPRAVDLGYMRTSAVPRVKSVTPAVICVAASSANRYRGLYQAVRRSTDPKIRQREICEMSPCGVSAGPDHKGWRAALRWTQSAARAPNRVPPLVRLRTPVSEIGRGRRFGHRMLLAPAVHAARTAREEDSASQGDLRVTECDAEPFRKSADSRSRWRDGWPKCQPRLTSAPVTHQPSRDSTRGGPEAPHRV